MSEKKKIEGDGFLFLCTSSYVCCFGCFDSVKRGCTLTHLSPLALMGLMGHFVYLYKSLLALVFVAVEAV